MLLNRDEFIEHWEGLTKGMTGKGSPLWIPEEVDKIRCEWFVNVRPVRINDTVDFNDFRLWCENQCQGKIRCFSSNATEEWWGFTNKNDIVWWMLKWT